MLIMLETALSNRSYKDSVFVDLFSTDEKAKRLTDRLAALKKRNDYAD